MYAAAMMASMRPLSGNVIRLKWSPSQATEAASRCQSRDSRTLPVFLWVRRRALDDWALWVRRLVLRGFGRMWRVATLAGNSVVQRSVTVDRRSPIAPDSQPPARFDDSITVILRSALFVSSIHSGFR
jgi:hypothetical protein